METSEDNEGFVIIDKCNSDCSGEVEHFYECGQEEFMHDPSPDHVVKVEVGYDYDASFLNALVHKQAYHFRDISGLFCQLPGKPFFVSLNRDYGVPSHFLSFLPEQVAVRTICNGLPCCQSCDGENTYYICNPATKERRAFPKSNFFHGPKPSLALAFEPSVLNFA
ncbi:F-box protein [Pyrus ussuriensis x Pyrus communis]|uniref:F-box protein n=1 Tax=Pyrus ussuriensis x Pyrus communis TaxID=2448454 RepID=A0A5N5GR05_9ROSA|nr:F-box protein [Pyrus ussuriensis x Pyrus communis]